MNGIKLALTLATAFALVTTGHTGECNSPAPLADSKDVENGYYNLEDHPIDAREKTRIGKLLKSLRGEWSGTEIVKICTGHFKTPTESFQTFDVQASVKQHHSGALRLEATKERRADRVTKLETLFLTPEINTDRGFRQAWHTIDVIDENTIIFSEKSRAQGANGFTRLIHQVNRIELQNNKLVLDTKLYVNGFFVEQTGWELHRRFNLQ